MSAPASIDDYITSALPNTQALLRELRAAIHAAAPDAKETISYGMPAFAQNGTLASFAALKNGIGVYPTSSGVAAFPSEVSPYVSTKGALRFPPRSAPTDRSDPADRAVSCRGEWASRDPGCHAVAPSDATIDRAASDTGACVRVGDGDVERPAG